MEPDGVYPDISGLSSAFIGFAGGFDGRQDCAHIEAAGLTAVCVERDPARIAGMDDLYPADWRFIEADVYETARRCFALGEHFDLVSLDPYSSQFQECADRLDLWMKLATRKVVLGTGRDTWLPLDLDGWQITDTIQRSSFNGGVFWTVYDRT